MSGRDYYDILGVRKDAKQEDIRRAYRKLARKFHPDVNKGKNAEEQFKQVNEAYDVLKDPEKRKRYDTYGSNWQQSSYYSSPGWGSGFSKPSGADGFSRSFRFTSGGDFKEHFGFDDIFSDLFGAGRGTSYSHGERTAHKKAQPHSVDINISLHDAFYGSSKTITLQSSEVGQLRGQSLSSRTFDVKIPKGVTNGSVVRLPQKGVQGDGGDILLKVHIQEDPQFGVDGHNLHTIVAVSPWEAALGAKVPVKTMEGNVTLSIPTRSQSGQKFRLRGKGIPKRQSQPGDMIVEIEIVIPESLTEEEEKLLKELARKSKFNPRVKKAQRNKRV